MKKILLLFFITQIVFSQSKTIALEEKIYNTIDVFVANPTVESLQKLELSERNFHPKSKPELLAFVILKCNKAYYENQFGQTNKAILSYEKAWQLYQKNKLSNYDIVESCLQPLGNLYAIIGDYDNAENTIKQYFYIATTEKNQSHKYAAILNLSNVYQNTGRINEAVDLLDKTIATEKLTSSQKGVLWNNLGNNYFLSNVIPAAKNAFENSIRLLNSDKSQSETLSNAYRNLAAIFCQQQNYEIANSNMEKAIEEFFKIPNKEPRKQAKLYYDIALLHFKQNQFAEADVNLKSVFSTLIPNFSKTKTQLPNQNSLYAETVLLDALDLKSELYLVQNQPKKALESCQLAFHIEALFQSMLVYENSKIISQIRNRTRTEKCIGIYYLLYQKEKKTNYLESAFLLSEQTKSAVLKQMLSDTNSKSREEKRIVEQLQNWNTIIVKEQQKLDNADISKINEAIKKQNELMLLLKSTATKTAGENKELDIKALYSKLEKENAVMVEYFVGKEKTYSFTLENNVIKLQIIAEKFDENSIIRRYISLFKDANSIADNPTEFNHQSNVTYTLLKLPRKGDHKNLILIPDGILNFLPFESLITRKTTTTNFAKILSFLY